MCVRFGEGYVFEQIVIFVIFDDFNKFFEFFIVGFEVEEIL